MKWKPIDVIVLILTCSIAIMLISVILGSLISGKQLTPEGRELMGKIDLALIAIISFYVGNKTSKR